MNAIQTAPHIPDEYLSELSRLASAKGLQVTTSRGLSGTMTYLGSTTSLVPAMIANLRAARAEAADPWRGLVEHLEHQRAWSIQTFGPEQRVAGVLDHIRKELKEIEADPSDVSEWVDVLILAFDGAWRAGWEPREIVQAIQDKQAKNEARSWPDWRTADPNKAIEHDRSKDLAS